MSTSFSDSPEAGAGHPVSLFWASRLAGPQPPPHRDTQPQLPSLSVAKAWPRKPWDKFPVPLGGLRELEGHSWGLARESCPAPWEARCRPAAAAAGARPLRTGAATDRGPGQG